MLRLLVRNHNERAAPRLASSPRPIFANFTERMTERNAKIGPGIHCRGIGAHALVVIQNLYNRQDIQNP